VNDFIQLNIQDNLGHSYTWSMVVLSLMLAITGSFLAVWQSLLLKTIQSPSAQSYVRLSGALAFAGGVWSMHFVGMLAFALPVKVTYDIPLTLTSILPAVLAGLWVEKWLANPDQNDFQLLLHSLVLGVGVGMMHYIGMEAMVMHAKLTYEPIMFSTSILLAVLLSALTLLMLRRMHQAHHLSHTKHIVVGGIGLGLAISSMHYTGMMASQFSGIAQFAEPVHANDYLFLTTLVFLVSTLIIVISYSGSLISQVRQKGDAVAVQGEELKAILKHAMIPLATTGVDGKIQTYNQQFKKLLNANDELIKHKSLALFIPDLTGRFNANGPAEWKMECSANAINNVEILEVKASRFSRGKETLWVVSVNDLTEIKDTPSQQLSNANYDKLTGLFNRFYFDIQINRELEAAHLNHQPLSLLIVDLDQYEGIVAKLGNSAGDELLRKASQQMKMALNKQNYLFRFGGHKFIIMLPTSGPDKASETAEYIRTSFGSEIQLNEEESAKVTVSIGIYCIQNVAEESPTQILKRADQALFIAITNGRDKSVLYANASSSSHQN